MLWGIKSLLIISILLALLIGCNGGEMSEKTTQLPTIKDIPASAWKKLSEKKIFFGHQSVGFNIIDGIKDFMDENQHIKLNIVETNKPTDFKAPLFGHSRVGKNRKPHSKIEAFAEHIERGIGNKADFAFFKFCYVDFPPKKGCNEVFKEYKKTLAQLKASYPKTTFIHVTVPLIAQQDGFFKAWVKRILGKSPRTYSDNIRRHELNMMMREEYAGKEALFDLARIESTLPDGRMIFFEKGEERMFVLNLEYTDDGAHLNEYGRRIVAEQLLIYLANLLEYI